RDADLDIKYVPYDGAGDARQAVLSGEADAMISSASGEKKYFESGDLNLIAITGEDRTDEYPDTPTFFELGIESIKDDYLWRAIYSKGDVSDDHLDTLSKAFEDATKESEWDDFLDDNNLEDFYKDSDEATEYFYDTVESAKETFEKE